MNIYNDFTELIGNTPMVSLNNIKKLLNLKGNIIAKLEYFNPAGSVKDRVGYALIREAEKQGILKKDSVIIEPTSGNTGIGLAAVAAVKGYKVILTMPETMSIERQKLLKAYGAQIVLTDGSKGMNGAIEKAEELAKEIPNAFIPSQFDNPVNPQEHFLTTGPEIWYDTDGNIDFFVAGVGTGGTLSGTGKYLKSKNSDIKVIAVEPDTSPVLSKGISGAHGIQGIGAGFIPKNLNTSIFDEVSTVSVEEAYESARLIAENEGFLVGISSGAALNTAIKLAEKEENTDKNIIVILPDTGERYLSTPLF